MPTYNFFITANSPTGLSDLELSDVCLHITDCLDHPVSERVDGSYGPADYEFDAYAVEVFEETGDRVWLYTRNASDPRSAQVDESRPSAEAPLSWFRRFFGR